MKYLIAAFLVLISLSGSFAQSEEVRKKHWQTEENLALEGYDPVSYLTIGKPKKGKKKFVYTYRGIMYRFESEANREVFIKNPDKYEPAYGGWCAYAMAEKGEKMAPDPETFKIINGKAYLFYDSFFTDLMGEWNAREKEMKPKADKAWNGFLKKK